MGRKRNRFDNIPVVMTVLVIVVFVFISKYPATLNMSASAGNTLVSLFPGIFVGLMSIFILSESSGYGQVPGLMGIGMSLCFLVGELNTNGLVTSQMLSGLTVSQVQIWIMVFSTLMGGLLYSYRR